jgi:hypothetical protein
MFKLMFYWFLVSIGLNFGLIPEEHAAMTAEEINRSVVQDSGRTDLCVDYAAGDFAPTTRALEMMNEAQQFLDRLYRNRGSEDCHTVDIAVGDYQIDVPNIRHVTRMDMTAADGTRHELRRRTYPFMREQYGESFSLLDTGKPVDWARLLVRGQVVGTYDLSQNPMNEFDPGTWTLPTWTEGQITSAASPSAYRQILKTYVRGRAQITVAGTYSNAAGAAAPVYVYRYRGGTPSVLALHALVTGSGALSLSYDATEDLLPGDQYGILFQAGIEVVVTSLVFGDPTGGYDYIFLPPADEAYTLCVYGGYYNTAFEDASDISWWSDTYPSILMMAYRMVIERHFHANETRVSYWMKQIALESKQLQIDLVAEETTNAPKYMRRMPSAVARRHLT